MPPATDAIRPGALLEGRYRVGRVLARGGMSTVHRGVDERLDRPVAIKVMDPALARDPAFVRRFEREARAAARLAHPGIVAVHDQGRDADGVVFLVLELVEGGTLRDVLRDQGRLHPAAALTVVEQMVAALRVAHTRGLVHRDVKPENVLISPAGELKVADFGLVGAAWGSSGTVDTGGSGSDDVILGTVAYLSPEQVAEGHADARSDLYAAGVVLFELLTGVPPHGGDTPLAVAYQHVHADVPAPSTRVGGVPRALDRLVLSVTRRPAGERPPDAAAFLAAARDARVASGLPFAPVPVPPPRPSTPPPPRSGGTRVLDLGDSAPPTVAAPRRDRGWDGRHDSGPVDSGPIDSGPIDSGPTDSGPVGSGPVDDAVDDEGWDADDDALPAEDAHAVGRAAFDDVDQRLERLERRRARVRSRRFFAAWVVLVTAATAVAGVVGWGLGVPG